MDKYDFIPKPIKGLVNLKRSKSNDALGSVNNGLIAYTDITKIDPLCTIEIPTTSVLWDIKLNKRIVTFMWQGKEYQTYWNVFRTKVTAL